MLDWAPAHAARTARSGVNSNSNAIATKAFMTLPQYSSQQQTASNMVNSKHTDGQLLISTWWG
jgi:hypothetical protein